MNRHNVTCGPPGSYPGGFLSASVGLCPPGGFAVECQFADKTAIKPVPCYRPSRGVVVAQTSSRSHNHPVQSFHFQLIFLFSVQRHNAEVSGSGLLTKT